MLSSQFSFKKRIKRINFQKQNSSAFSAPLTPQMRVDVSTIKWAFKFRYRDTHVFSYHVLKLGNYRIRKQAYTLPPDSDLESVRKTSRISPGFHFHGAYDTFLKSGEINASFDMNISNGLRKKFLN